MIEEGRGGLIVEADPEALAQALRCLAQDDDLRVAMGRYNAQKARRLYAYEPVVDRLLSLYASCGAGRSGR
jgi:glycosyltransferase involved in cell wall biosynthesis